MNKRQFIAFLIFYVILILMTIRSCNGGPEIGDQLVIKREAALIANWNAVSYLKPVACVLNEGEKVVVLDFSTLNFGSSHKEPIIQVQTLDGSCAGWAFPDQLRKVKEDK